MKLNKLVIILIIGALVFASCDIGLGPALVLKGPVVRIVAPSIIEGQTEIAVGDVFNLTGTVSSGNEIAYLEIKMAYLANEVVIPVQHEWRSENKWQYREHKNSSWSSWRTYTESDYFNSNIDPDLYLEINSPSYKRSGDTITWNLPILMTSLETYRDYFITISAVDVTGRRDGNSTQKIKVYYDNGEPNFIVRVPVIFDGNELPDQGWSSKYQSYPTNGEQDVFETWIYDPVKNPEGTFNYIDQWIIKSTDFEWEIDKDMIGDYSLSFEFTNRHNIEDPIDCRPGDEKQLYFRYEWDETGIGGALPKYGVFTDGSTLAGYTKIRGAIKTEDIMMRDPATGLAIPGDLPKILGKYTPIQIVSRITDGAGNSAHKSNGWFAWFPEADKPWAHINFGTKYSADDIIPPNAADLEYILAGSTTEHNYVYDNEGVLLLEWNVYKLKDGSLESVEPTGAAEDGSDLKPWKGEVLPPDNLVDTRKWRWDFTAEGKFLPGRYKIEVIVTDVNHVKSAPMVSYFSIESNNVPSIKEVSFPSNTETLWGDGSGNFTLKGIVQIKDTTTELNSTDASVKVDRVTVAWIKPHWDSDVSAGRLLKYTDRNYVNWNKALNSLDPFFEDDESKVWEVPSANIIFDPATDGNNNNGQGNGTGQEDYNFSLNLNLFNDWGIGPEENLHSDQVFLVRATYNARVDRSLSSMVQQYTAMGDNSPPTLTIEKIIITNAGAPRAYENKGAAGTMSFEMLSRIYQYDTLKLEGTWSDDSFDKWSGINNRFEFFKGRKVSWGSIELEFDEFSAGTWTSKLYTFPSNNAEATIDLSVHLTDLNNNPGEGRVTVDVETDIPVLTRISSDINDGSYGDSKDTYSSSPNSRYVDIFIDFNGNVRFYPISEGAFPVNSQDAPYLDLSNGGRAFFFSGNGGTRLVFRYFIDGNTPSTSTLPTVKPNYGGSDTAGANLDVNRIVYSTAFPEGCIITMQESGSSAVIFAPDAFHNGSKSLARNKDIKIDKTPPRITDIKTAASDTRPHGNGSPIYLTVTFDDRVTVSGATAGNFYLNLGGGNLVARQAKAVYANVAGPNSVSFLYSVQTGDDTGVNNLTVSSVEMLAGLSIKDVAGNEIVKPAVIAFSINLGKSIRIDTVAPAAPTVSVTAYSLNNYVNKEFIITGLETTATVEYHLDCPNPASPPATGWITAANIGTQTSPISLERTGNFNIAARQYDNATPTNASLVSAVVPLNIDKNPLVTRLSSSMADGIYGYTTSPSQVISLDLYFRIPVTLSGSPYLTLDVQNAGANNDRATLRAGQTGAPRTSFTFDYTIPNANTTAAKLDLINYASSFVMNGATFTDSAGINVTTHVSNLTQILDSNRFAQQKNIEIMAGVPASTGSNFNAATELTVTFNRDISPADTENQLVIIQDATNFKIPAVMSETKWDEIFVNRTNIWQGITTPTGFGSTETDKAAAWEALGSFLYQKGSNGAVRATNTDNANLNADTSVKYVLKFDVDTADAASTVSTNIPGVAGTVTMQNVRDIMRQAEALRFNSKDREVTIITNRTLRVNLNAASGGKGLSVKGATYTYTVPVGFVADVLDKTNTDVVTGSGALAGMEAPVIRVNKGGDTDTIVGTGANRQAQQPLTSSARIDCRTPGAFIRYQTRTSTDTIGQLLWRNGETGTISYAGDTGLTANGTGIANGLLPLHPEGTGTIANGIYPYGLPHLGNQIGTNNATNNALSSFNDAKRRPQSGYARTPAVLASVDGCLNYWVRIESKNYDAYNQTSGTNSNNAFTPFDIGSDNYNDGGMIIHIHAQSASNTGFTANLQSAYEAAYRSVFVFQNASINRNGNASTVNGTAAVVRELLDLGHDGGASTATAILPQRNLGRMWIRGGDSTSGEPSIPNFPIARDRNLAKKARLMTPIDANAKYGGMNGPATMDPSITHSDIPGTYDDRGNYLWVWVTWNVNVITYIDPFCGQLPVNTAAPQVPIIYKEIYKGIVPFKEHYPLIPGRTTVFETRRVYRFRYGGSGGQLDFGALAESPRNPTDLTTAELALYLAEF